ncbi:hypothetical protein Sjap_014244 [Stephania japonica]|uniref:Cation/H+ exchanger domain-containing protein n=1 Tax=Stephania japonica TaxID=461633 RepID=A0AAP0NYG4_9MAGN
MMEKLPWDYALLCDREIRSFLSRGIWRGDGPLESAISLFILQIAVSTFVTGFVDHLMRPFGHSSFVSHMIGGFLLCPVLLGANDTVRTSLFSKRTEYVHETVQLFAITLYLYVGGAQIDLSALKREGRKAFVIGLSSILLPLICTSLTTYIIINFFNIDPQQADMLPFVAMVEGFSSTQVIATLLAELKLLNSQLGHLTAAASTVTFMLSWFAGFSVVFLKQSSKGGVWKSMGMLFCTMFMGVLVVSMRPLLLWLFKTSQRQRWPFKEFPVLVILFMVLVSALLGEIIGQHYVFGPMLLGLVTPSGPPIGEVIQNKINTFLFQLMLPLFYVSAAARASTFNGIDSELFWTIELVILVGFFGKVFATFLPCLFYKMPVRDCFLAGLIMSTQGIVDILYYRYLMNDKLISAQAYSLMTITAVVFGGIISPLLKTFYKPSRKYLTYKARTLEFSKNNSELRILVCIYRDANVPSVIDLLEASNPERESPLVVYLLHLIELQGLAQPVLISHNRRKTQSSIYRRSSSIFNAFGHYERQNHGITTVSPFTAVAPYATMHTDICNLALDKKTTLVIIPFHRQHNFLDGLVDVSHRIMNVNCNVLNLVPCSVGILVDPLIANANYSIFERKRFFRIAVIFLEGPDDREALAYSSRMAGHPNVSLTLVRLIADPDDNSRPFEKRLDVNAVSEFRLNYMGNDRVVIKEEVVADCVGTVKVIRSVEIGYDLILVGRHHRMESPLVNGLADWNELPELGFIGDLLATLETREGSILVVQQAAFVSEETSVTPNAVSPKV